MADDKINSIDDIKYGQMNPLESSLGSAWFNPSTITAVGAIQAKNISQFVPNIIQGKCRWNAIILRSTPQKRPWVASNFQRSMAALDRTPAGPQELYFSYKIFIAELDGFKQLPDKFSRGLGGESNDENLVNIARDAVAPLGKNWGPLDYGTPVEVTFEDKERGKLATIVEVHYDQRIPLQPGDTTGNMFKTVISGERRSQSQYGTTGTVGTAPGPTVTDASCEPIKIPTAQVRSAQQVFQDLATYGGIHCVALRQGIVGNAIEESGFDSSVPGDVATRVTTPGNTGGICVEYKSRRYNRKGIYAAFGLFQMNINLRSALGWQMLEWAGATQSTNEEKLKVLTGEDGYKKQIQFVGEILKEKFPGILNCTQLRTSQEYHDWWLEKIENPNKAHWSGRKRAFMGHLRAFGMEPVV